MVGVAFEIVDIRFNSITNEGTGKKTYGPITGQAMSSVKECCKRAFSKHSPRIVQPMYNCHVQVFGGMDKQGVAYVVLNRRKSRIVCEDIKDGSNIYEIMAHMPVAESFGFADELFTQSSGAAHGQLVFSHWEILDQDPNYIPMTKEEIEESGAYNLSSLGNNIARTYIDDVRERKGLPLRQKLIEHANKQRTLSKKK